MNEDDETTELQESPITHIISSNDPVELEEGSESINSVGSEKEIINIHITGEDKERLDEIVDINEFRLNKSSLIRLHLGSLMNRIHRGVYSSVKAYREIYHQRGKGAPAATKFQVGMYPRGIARLEKATQVLRNDYQMLLGLAALADEEDIPGMSFLTLKNSTVPLGVSPFEVQKVLRLSVKELARGEEGMYLSQDMRYPAFLVRKRAEEFDVEPFM